MKIAFLLLLAVSVVNGFAQPAPSGQAAGRDAMHYFKEGSILFREQKYSDAIDPYQRALDLEKQKHILSQDFFRVLVDNLGMAYGISGNIPQAKATFEYGLTVDLEYPMFFYNIACVYGELNKMNESLDQLRLAYKYKANMIKGETLPDPLQDDSFRNFVRNEDFVSQVHRMQR